MFGIPRHTPMMEFSAFSRRSPLTNSCDVYLSVLRDLMLPSPLFGLSVLSFTSQASAFLPLLVGFAISMVSGCTLEVLGYPRRMVSHQDPLHDV